MKKPRLAILFRYGAGEHVHFLPALPELVADLSSDFEVHHFGFRTAEPILPSLREHALVHEFPIRVRRSCDVDKRWKALLWSLLLPLLGLYLQLRRFQVVFVDETLPLSAAALRLAYRRKLAFTIHDFFLEVYFPRNSSMGRIGKRLQALDLHSWRGLDLIFTRVEATRSFLEGQGIPPARILVAHDPCDLKLFAPGDRSAARLRWGFQEEDIVLVHHGVMHPNKGNDRVLRALSRLKPRLPHLKFLLIGEGPEYEALEDLILELGLKDQVRLTGWLASMREVAEALNAADIGLVMRVGQSSDHFHVTSTLVHNLATGLPVLAARLDGIQEIIQEGREGFLFDPACGDEFDEKLLQIVSDTAGRVRMGSAARRTAEQRFDRKRIASQMAEGLRNTCQDS